MMAFMRFQDMKNEQETIIANAVGQQIKQVGEAVNGYINIRYDKLSTLTSSSSQSSDPGPRVCNASGCEITYQTLINEGLLPASYTGINAQKSSYKIILKRSGLSPNYVVNGLITTTLPWMEGDKYRYDLLGRAIVLRPYSKDMLRLAAKGVKTTVRPSGHNINESFDKTHNGGSIPPNFIDDDTPSDVLKMGNNAANDGYTKKCKASGVKIHPARFPMQLPEFFIKMLTDEGDIVLDPFGGSMTTGAVSESLNRRWIGIDTVEEYLDGALFRFEE